MQKLLQSRYKAVFVFLILLPWVLITVTRHPIDFSVYSNTVRGWLSGQIHLYDGQTEFYLAPWAILALAPFIVTPQPFGMLLYLIAISSALVWATWTLVKPTSWWTLAISLVTLYTALLIFNGQWDSIVLASLALGWIAIQMQNPWLLGLAIIGLTTKPTNIFLPAILLLYNLRNWPKDKLIQMTIIPLAALIGSVFIAGFNWPLQYIHNLQEHPYPPNYVVMTPWTNTLYLMSYWEYLPTIGRIFLLLLLLVAIFLLIRNASHGIDQKTLAIALVINIVASPHALLYSFIFLAPIQVILLREHRIWGFILVIVALFDLIAAWQGWGLYLYPLTMLLTIMLIEIKDHPIYNMKSYSQAI